MKILLTGATGYLGSRLLRCLQSTGAELSVLVREKNQEWPSGVQVFVWGELDSIKPAFTHIVHLAALTRFNCTEAEAEESNIAPTKALLTFAQRCRALEKFVLASTVYASGKLEGEIREERLGRPPFANFYESSKWECEELVADSGLPWQVQRIATVIADDAQGGVGQFNAVHNTLKLFYFGLISLIPGRAEVPIYLVNGDFVVESMRELLEKAPVCEYFHLCHPLALNLKLGALIDRSFELFSADERFRRKRILKPLFTDFDSYKKLVGGLQGFQGVLSQALSSISPFGEQLFIKKDLRVENCRKYATTPFPDPALSFDRAIQTLIARQFSLQENK